MSLVQRPAHASSWACLQVCVHGGGYVDDDEMINPTLYAVTLEGVRATTCRDHLSNSTISGALTGAATFALHCTLLLVVQSSSPGERGANHHPFVSTVGRKDAISGAIAGSILGTVSHWLHASVKPGQTWARLREDLGLGTPPEGEGEAAAPSPSGKLRAVRPEDRWEEFAERWRGK